MMKRFGDTIISGSIVALPMIATVAAKALSPLLTLWAVFACINTKRAQLLPLWRDFWQQNRALIVSMLVLIIWAGMSAVWSVSSSESLEGFLKLSGIMLSGLAALCFIKLPDLSEKIYRLLTGYFLLILAILALEIFTPVTLIKWLAEAVDKTYYAVATVHLNRGLNALVLLVWPLAYYVHRRGSALGASCYIIFFFALLTHLSSASALLGMLVSSAVLALLFLSRGRFTKFIRYAVPLGLLAVLLGCIIVFYPASSEDLARELRPYGSSRTLIWHGLVRGFDGNWWLGDGMRTSHFLPMAQHFLTEMKLTDTPLHPHLTPLQLVLELGIIGLILGLMFVYQLFARIGQIDDPMRRNWAIACAVSYACVGLFAFNVWMNWWLAYGFILAILFRPPADDHQG